MSAGQVDILYLRSQVVFDIDGIAARILTEEVIKLVEVTAFDRIHDVCDHLRVDLELVTHFLGQESGCDRARERSRNRDCSDAKASHVIETRYARGENLAKGNKNALEQIDSKGAPSSEL